MSNKRAKPDHYTLKAKKEGYPARSVYKLEEMDKKFGLIKPGIHIIDAGASPGSWTLYALRKLKGKGRVTSIDLKPLTLKPAPNLSFWQGDLFGNETAEFLNKGGPYQLLISDAAPSTTGNRLVDTRRSLDLVEKIIQLAEIHVAQGGNLVIKIFMGGDEAEPFELMKKQYHTVKRLKPKAVRPESFETYLIGLDKI